MSVLTTSGDLQGHQLCVRCGVCNSGRKSFDKTGIPVSSYLGIASSEAVLRCQRLITNIEYQWQDSRVRLQCTSAIVDTSEGWFFGLGNCPPLAAVENICQTGHASVLLFFLSREGCRFVCYPEKCVL